MSEKRNPEKNPSMDKSIDPKRESPENTETQQVEKSIHSIDNVYQPDSLDALNFQNPNFDIALARLILQKKENQPSAAKSTDDQIEALKHILDQLAELERAAELALAPESDANADLESAGHAKAVSGSAGDSTDQMVASESPVQSSASWDPTKLEPPESPRMNLLYNLVRKHFPPLFTEGNRMRDDYGVTTIRDETLLESYYKLFFLLNEHRSHNGDAGSENLLSKALISEIKYFYSLSLIRNLVLEGESSDSSPLFPPPEEGRLFCAALILGFTFLAFAKYTLTGRVRKFKQIAARCLIAGVPLLDESQTQPSHPLTRWLQCITESYTEILHYSDTLSNSLNCFSTRNAESINRELDRLATK